MFRTRWMSFTFAFVLAMSCPLWAQDDNPFKEQPDPFGETGENPFFSVRDLMANVVSDLGKLSTGKPTQDKESEIVKKLDVLIQELEKQCEKCNGGSSTSRPTSPLRDSQLMGGPGGIGDLRDPKKSEKKWAQLPPHERDRILQSMTEGFPAQYQEVLERYYRRLADEKTVAEGPANGTNTTDSKSKPEASANPTEPKTESKTNSPPSATKPAVPPK
jgi:hypothetical protein